MQKAFWTGLAAALLLVIGPQVAQASSIRLFQGSNLLEILDDQAGDENLDPGIIVLTNRILGDFINISVTATSKDVSGSQASPLMVLTVYAASENDGSLKVEFTDDDFGSTGTNAVADTDSALALGLAPDEGLISYSTWIHGTNQLFGGRLELNDVVTDLMTTQDDNDPRYYTLLNGAGPYALTQRFSITHDVASPTGQLSGGTSTLRIDNGGAPSVPDGGSTAALLGSALMALSLVRRRLGVR